MVKTTIYTTAAIGNYLAFLRNGNNVLGNPFFRSVTALATNGLKAEDHRKVGKSESIERKTSKLLVLVFPQDLLTIRNMQNSTSLIL